jgi:hypothetical protein
MTCSDEDHGRSRRLGAEDRGWSQVLSVQAVERLGGAGCGLHRARGDEERSFLS